MSVPVNAEYPRALPGQWTVVAISRGWGPGRGLAPLARTYPMVQCIDEVDAGSGLFDGSPGQWTVVGITPGGGDRGGGSPPPRRRRNSQNPPHSPPPARPPASFPAPSGGGGSVWRYPGKTLSGQRRLCLGERSSPIRANVQYGDSRGYRLQFRRRTSFSGTIGRSAVNRPSPRETVLILVGGQSLRARPVRTRCSSCGASAPICPGCR